ncbi:MAG: hypothetical protein RID53_33010 [Coleofasciculus sp. B1-GNL1-01]|uniref:hypothetical protein n=1 Tax=Coleofasciculus sp. B1-GNL1-01 TaxID=3068484 RepID=UPI0032F99B50
MSQRTQINLRIDNELLQALREKCASEGCTQTEFITNAIKSSLGIPITQANLIEIDERIAAHIQPIREELDQLRAALGEFAA